MPAPRPRLAAARPLVHARGLSLVYRVGAREIRALDGIDLEIPRGQLLCALGPSGSGKSSLLHVLCGLRRPSAGRVWIEDLDLLALDEPAAARLRRTRVGIVFQSFNLLPMLSVAENVAFPLEIERVSQAEVHERVTRVLRELDLTQQQDHYPEELSGGQQQRVAIARALVIEPDLLLADEPTGNLDAASGARIWALLRDLTHSRRTTTLLVTHDLDATRHCDRVVEIEDGRIRQDRPPALASA